MPRLRDQCGERVLRQQRLLEYLTDVGLQRCLDPARAQQPGLQATGGRRRVHTSLPLALSGQLPCVRHALSPPALGG